MLKQIPNILTLSNLTCGLLGIIQVFTGDVTMAFWFMLAAGVFDFFDGFAARLLGVSGELGKQLDSLADGLTFGVLPGFIWWHYLNTLGHCSTQGFCINKYVFLAIPLAAVYRLAVFNIDTRQTKDFIGTPTPISGLAIASAVFLFSGDSAIGNWIGSQTYAMIFIPFIFAYFMTCDLPMISFKLSKGDKSVPFVLAFLILSILTISLFYREAGFIIFILLFVISQISHYFVSKHE